MFKKKDQITVAVEKVMNLLSGKQRGDTVYYKELEKIGVVRGTESYQTIVIKARKKLLAERNIAIRCENAVGFRLLTVQQQVQECSKDRHKRIRNQASKGIAEVHAAPDESLSDAMRLLKVRQVQELKHTKISSKLAIEDVKDLVPKSDVMPRRRI